MSSEWKRVQIKHLGQIVTGKTPSTSRSDFFGGNIPFLTPTDMQNGFKEVSTARTLTQSGLAAVKNCLIPKGVAVSCIGWQMGKSVLVLKPTVTNQQINTIIANENKFDLGFVYYALSNMREKIFQYGATATRTPIVNKTSFGELSLDVPHLSEQQRISEFFSILDDRIALLRETNATLEAIAQALFKSWFVDFDPVHANAGTRPATLPPEMQALFPSAFIATPQGMVPEGWDIAPFTETISVIGGGTPKTSVSEYWNGDIPWFSVVDAPAGSDVFVIDTEKHITELGLSNSSTKLLPAGTTIISARGTVGRLAITGRDMTMNQSCYGLRGNYGDEYFTYFTICRLVDALKQRSHGSVFDTITRDTLSSLSIVYPDKTLVGAFEDVVGGPMVKIKNNIKQVQTLATLRDTLLPRLISGQLRLPDAEAALVEVGA